MVVMVVRERELARHGWLSTPAEQMSGLSDQSRPLACNQQQQTLATGSGGHHPFTTKRAAISNRSTLGQRCPSLDGDDAQVGSLGKQTPPHQMMLEMLLHHDHVIQTTAMHVTFGFYCLFPLNRELI